MVGIESITQVLPSFTGKASSKCLGSAFFGNTSKKMKELALFLQ